MANITGLAVQDGYSWYDVDVDVIKDDGTIILSEQQMLGEKGKMMLKSNVVTPYGTINVPATASEGDYTLTLTLYDIFSGDTVERSTTFIIE